MHTAPMPSDEATRLLTLHGLNLLDTAPEERFDRLTRLACRAFGVPMAGVSLVDGQRQWFKSSTGLSIEPVPRDISFCAHALARQGALVVPDAALDERFEDSPMVAGPPYVRFYVGYPLRVSGLVGASALGTLCLMDNQPRDFDERELATLRELARMAEQELAAAQLSLHDDLTGLCNHRGFDTLAGHALSLCRRLRKPMAMMVLGLDDLGAITASHGPEERDWTLQRFAELLTQAFRDSDVVGRIAPDEFAVLLTNIGDGALTSVLSRLCKGVEQHNRTAHRDYPLRFSAGTVRFDAARHHGTSEMLAEAHRTMVQHQHQHRALPLRA